jgi:hypothetical protein
MIHLIGERRTTKSPIKKAEEPTQYQEAIPVSEGHLSIEGI